MFNRWDILLLIVATVIAVRSLMRLMQKRRDVLVEQVQKQLDAHQQAVAAQEIAKAKAKDAA